MPRRKKRSGFRCKTAQSGFDNNGLPWRHQIWQMLLRPQAHLRLQPRLQLHLHPPVLPWSGARLRLEANRFKTSQLVDA